MAKKLTLKQARDLFEYNPKTGQLIWKRCYDSWGRNNNREFGKPAGATSVNGYRYVAYKGVQYLAHRLIWLIVTGRWPQNLIDHINGDRDDNRWKNLREADKSKNGQNYINARENKTGYRGVRRHKKSGRWLARIRIEGKEKHLGLFDTPKEAGDAYIEASKNFFGEFSPHR